MRVCPLLGFLDAGAAQVGCLGHPKVTGGADLRDCGVYRAAICETFTCPSFGWLEDAQARLVQAACQDWYLYGLVITDVEFVRGCLRLLEWERAAPRAPRHLMARPEALEAVRRLFALKETAPGRGPHAAMFGRFTPDTEGEPVSRTLDYAAPGRARRARGRRGAVPRLRAGDASLLTRRASSSAPRPSRGARAHGVSGVHCSRRERKSFATRGGKLLPRGLLARCPTRLASGPSRPMPGPGTVRWWKERRCHTGPPRPGARLRPVCGRNGISEIEAMRCVGSWMGMVGVCRC